jgi:F-type H+-transporting ATPase subunit a
MEHSPLVAVFVNKAVVWCAGIFGLHPAGDLIPAHVVMAFMVTLLIVVSFRLGVRKLDVFPSRLQVLFEMVYGFFSNLINDMVGHAGLRFLPAVGTLGIFIALSNLIGLVPEMGSPTANINVPLACAVFIFVYYNVQGIKAHGLLGYFKTFMGPVWWLAVLMVPIEVISHLARPLSLTIRLFGNIFGEDLVIVILAMIVPFVVPVPMMAMAVFTSLIQAFVFVLMSSVYLAGAVSSEH